MKTSISLIRIFFRKIFLSIKNNVKKNWLVLTIVSAVLSAIFSCITLKRGLVIYNSSERYLQDAANATSLEYAEKEFAKAVPFLKQIMANSDSDNQLKGIAGNLLDEYKHLQKNLETGISYDAERAILLDLKKVILYNDVKHLKTYFPEFRNIAVLALFFLTSTIMFLALWQAQNHSNL